MKVTGIIAEYNPFHRGHKYQIDYCKKELHSDYVVVVMSGDYVQRGTPALLPKHVRAEMALRCGADLVLEMPVSVSTASAEAFAMGAVSMLDGLHVTDYLCFGSEYGEVCGCSCQRTRRIPTVSEKILKCRLFFSGSTQSGTGGIF